MLVRGKYHSCFTNEFSKFRDKFDISIRLRFLTSYTFIRKTMRNSSWKMINHVIWIEIFKTNIFFVTLVRAYEKILE